MFDEIFNDSKGKMDRTIEHCISELSTIRTGRASTNLVDNLKVDYYGSMSPIKNIAHVSVPESQLIVIQPFDPTSLETIEKCIVSSDLGLSPNNDGSVIRLNIPPLTEERRKEIMKSAHQIAEDSRISIRNIRRTVNEEFKDLEKNKSLSEDNLKRALDNIQELTDQYIERINSALKNKEDEILI